MVVHAASKAAQASRLRAARLRFRARPVVLVQGALPLLNPALLHPVDRCRLLGGSDRKVEVAMVGQLQGGEGGEVVVGGGGGGEGGRPVQEGGEVPPQAEPAAAVRRRRPRCPVGWGAPLTGVRLRRGEGM